MESKVWGDNYPFCRSTPHCAMCPFLLSYLLLRALRRAWSQRGRSPSRSIETLRRSYFYWIASVALGSQLAQYHIQWRRLRFLKKKWGKRGGKKKYSPRPAGNKKERQNWIMLNGLLCWRMNSEGERERRFFKHAFKDERHLASRNVFFPVTQYPTVADKTRARQEVSAMHTRTHFLLVSHTYFFLLSTDTSQF